MAGNTAQVMNLNSGTQRKYYDWSKEVIINKPKLLEEIDRALDNSNLSSMRDKISSVYSVIEYPRQDKAGLVNIDKNGDTAVFKKGSLLEELNQILEARTIERAAYYLGRLKKGVTETKTSKINDINLNRWKEYVDIITDSLWIIDRRDTSGAHIGSYWGNFIPQIPHQLMQRYTKEKEWVIDPFAGSGTTLIECRRLGRNGIGIELNPYVSKEAQKLIKKEKNTRYINTELITADSRYVDIGKALGKYKVKQVQLIIMHPPYHDIIKFSKSPDDLSNAKTVEDFIKMFCDVFDNVSQYLEKGRFLAIVIGDKYSKGEWVPLGFKIMNEVLKRNFLLKSIIVKNFDETKGKRNQADLWRYRALVGGFYIFKHEYILLFKKK